MTGAAALWIVLWAIGFGRVDDSFIVTVPPIFFIAEVVRTHRRAKLPPPD